MDKISDTIKGEVTSHMITTVSTLVHLRQFGGNLDITMQYYLAGGARLMN